MENDASPPLLSTICKVLGHQWIYDDYSDGINADGEEMGFNTYRKCMRCNYHEYFSEGIYYEKEPSQQEYHDVNGL